MGVFKFLQISGLWYSCESLGDVGKVFSLSEMDDGMASGA